MSTHEHLKPTAPARTFRPATRNDEFEPVVGKPMPRVDGALKVEGRARFAAEVPMEKIAYGALHYSSIARGRIDSIDLSAAREAAGVIYIMTHENAPRMKAPPLFPKGAAGSTRPVMQDAQIHWNGRPSPSSSQKRRSRQNTQPHSFG